MQKKINELSTDEVEGLWVDKDGLMRRFEGLNRNTLNKWLVEMRLTNEFSKYVINPTHKLVWINVDGFVAFLQWKAHERGY
ncbi:hypothetical protein [Enterococcus dongliensis]|uniref:hypothetical protein n=1 Tax=Enterococcus dongliensis TaxID=2559925 RepID=UPI00288FCFF8|nr:hypothetical protein [Enterococcus dongliensis]MDT2613287.1 hypothetical protein [Enterococcus dongliensis]